VRPEVDGTTRTPHLATDGAHAQLIRHWRTGLDGENHCATVATSLELDGHDGLVRGARQE
jgi:hypothetical protein